MSLNCVLFLVHVQIFHYLVSFSQIMCFRVCEKDNIVFVNLQQKDKGMFWHPEIGEEGTGSLTA